MCKARLLFPSEIPVKRAHNTVLFRSLPRPLLRPFGPKNESSISTRPARVYPASRSAIALRTLWAINHAVL
jgi:hypothetical protein